jgi:hypothetical protein
MRKFLLATAFLAGCSIFGGQEAKAQQSFIIFCQPPNTQAIPCPAPLTSAQIGTTIAVTNTFQIALAASAWVANPTPGAQARQGCLLQNNGTHSMYVYFKKTGAAVASLTNSFILQANGLMNCNSISGGVLQDEIDISGTSGDAYVLISQ